MASTSIEELVPEEDFDAVNADALEDDTAEESPVGSEYSTEDEDVSITRMLPHMCHV